jgi:hypothetical protein
MSAISHGFHRRRQPDADASRVPPGQYVTGDFPVLSAGPPPHTPLEEWSFTIRGAVGEPVSWPWEEFVALPSETITTDIHCVTKWPDGWEGHRGRVTPELLRGVSWPPAELPLIYICGPTAFVEATAGQLVDLGHDPSRIRTERFGPTGS